MALTPEEQYRAMAQSQYQPTHRLSNLQISNQQQNQELLNSLMRKNLYVALSSESSPPLQYLTPLQPSNRNLLVLLTDI